MSKLDTPNKERSERRTLTAHKEQLEDQMKAARKKSVELLDEIQKQRARLEGMQANDPSDPRISELSEQIRMNDAALQLETLRHAQANGLLENTRLRLQELEGGKKPRRKR